jgi:hypothetical protein
MNTGSLVKYGLIAAVIGWVVLSDNDDSGYVEDEIDLNIVLDVTSDTLHKVSDTVDENATNDEALTILAETLAMDYNQKQPALYKNTIGVSLQQDASLMAYDDVNNNSILDEKEPLLFMIEIDGEQARIIASSRSGAVNEHHFSGSGLLTGFLIGSMLSRQRGAGVTSKSLASKKPVTARAAAKARAGSGSHSKGK